MKEIIVDGITYVPKLDKDSNELEKDYVIIRSNHAGVFAGHIESIREGTQYSSVDIKECRRLWYWNGAASISQLSIHGTSKPKECKFPQPVSRQTINGVIEIIPCTLKARASIEGVEIWEV